MLSVFRPILQELKPCPVSGLEILALIPAPSSCVVLRIVSSQEAGTQKSPQGRLGLLMGLMLAHACLWLCVCKDINEQVN